METLFKYMGITVEMLVQRIDSLEKRVAALEEIVEDLIPEDDEKITVREPKGEITEYKPGMFEKLARESGLI